MTTAGVAFQQSGSALAGLGADGPLADAAAGVPQLATAGACHAAQSAIASATTSAADAVTTLGGNLGVAAGRYEAQDQAASSAIKAVGPEGR
ncbi:type VII secretion target [Mycolicibacterium sediminis]|uniref:type VII secretion target n=1 Tax=Mycolicibacterium sediminis TaxID=1286180 RepID=UPI001FE3B3B1